MAKIQNKFKVVSVQKVSSQFYRLCLDAQPIVRTVRPGQFIHIKVSDNLEPFFRRPFSVSRVKKYVEILFEIVGRGTQILASKEAGDQLDVLGPLGNSFSLPPPGTKQVIMIAGGIGVAPFMMLSDVLTKKDYECILLYGARTKAHVFSMKEFKNNGCKVYIATEDGSVGVKGRVDKLYSNIKGNFSTAVYTCGPKPMMASVRKFSNKHDYWCEASCEEIMACGLGACLGCSIKTADGYKTVCHEGPVFNINKLIF